MSSEIHYFLNINFHDNQSQPWWVNHKEKIGHLHMGLQVWREKKFKKCIQNPLLHRVNVTSVSIETALRAHSRAKKLNEQSVCINLSVSKNEQYARNVWCNQ